MGISTFPAAASGFDMTKIQLRHTITSTTNNIGIPADVNMFMLK